MNLSRIGGVLCSLLYLVSLSVAAQDFPNRAIRIVRIFAPGSATDANARFIAQRMSEQFGQPVIVENNAGAGGLLAMRSVPRALLPGYTLLYTTNGLVGNLYAFRNPGYKLEDYTLVGTAGLSGYGMLLHDSIPARTVPELVAFAKANPTRLNAGVLGPTAGSNILVERLKAATGIEMVSVPFKGGGPAAVALLAGQIQVYFATYGTVRARLKNPQMRALAVTGDKRSRILPDLPTFRELGNPGMSLGVWNAIFVPSAAPQPAIQKLQETMTRINASPEMQAQMERMDFEFWDGSAAEFMSHIKAEGVAIGEDIKRLNLPVQD